MSSYGDCGYASDVFSAGVCCLELWVGRVWSDVGEEDEATLRGDRMAAVGRVERNDPDVGRLLRRMMAKDPRDRPTARECQREMVKIRKKAV